MADARLTDPDRRQLQERGIDPAEAERQLRHLENPPSFVRLVRPCTPGDGIETISADRMPQLHALHAEANRTGRFVKFVPASGAASRMFRGLLHFHRGSGRGESWDAVTRRATEGEPAAWTLVELLSSIERFPFLEDLDRVLSGDGGPTAAALAAEGRFAPILDALLGAAGLAYAERPKGLLGFHRYPDGSRTPFEEQLVEAAQYVRDGSGVCRLHLTVSREHRAAFEGLLAAVRQRYEKRFDASFVVEWSVQKPSTDTLSVDVENVALRDEEGRLLLRPGGHGALIENLGDLAADLVFVKNIDNVQPDRLKEATLSWKRALGGLLVELQHNAFESLARLKHASEPPELGSIGSALHVELNGGRPREADRRRYLIDRLDRPLRVCGVVPNTGEPGGGPFWVRGADGTITPQVVESAQVDPQDEEQQRIFQSSTHFNPVDLVCSLRDPDGLPYDLSRFVDHDAVIVTHKSSGGQDLKALERPGLWNGAMAGWNTVFVEVPLATFSPVKTILDLLRPEHQPA